MRIALIGATGNIGSRILAELVQRGHAVTAIARGADSLAPRPGVTPCVVDAADADALAGAIEGHDAVISAARFLHVDYPGLIRIARTNGLRLLVVGGAGSLEVEPGRLLIEVPQFPEAARPEAQAGIELLKTLRGESELDWTFLSPSMLIGPGERTGQFRLGGDQLLTNDKGSSISSEDFAVAMVDELERPAHTRRRFTVGY